MAALLSALLLLSPFGQAPAPQRPRPSVVEEQPLAQPDFVLLHTNDTRGYLEGCG